MGDQDIRGAAARAAFDALDDVVVVVAVDAEAGYPVVDANPALASRVGDADGVIGRPLTELQPREVVNGFAAQVDEVLRTGRSLRYQAHHEGPAGRTTLEVSVCPMAEVGDDPPHVAALVHDVTALRRVHDTLLEVERVTRTGTWTWNVADDTVRWSSQLYEVFGLRRDQLEPSFAGYLQRVHAEDRAGVEAAISATFETGEAFELDHRTVTPWDEVRWLHCTGRRIDDLQGRPVRMSGTAQHLTRGV